MDGHEDDISILPDMGDETFAEDSDAPSPSTFLFRSQSAIPASTHALQTAYRDLTKRYNVLDHKYRSLNRQRRNSAQSGDRLKLSSENNFPSPTFDGPNMEMGAAAMADQGSVDDHAQQSYINLLSGQLNQKISQMNSLHNKLSETTLQFEEFREKHKRCSQAVNKISQLEGERRELLLQNAKLRKEVDDLRQKLAESALDTSTVRLQNFRSGVVHPDENILHPDSNPSSAPGPYGNDVVNPSEVVYRRLEEEISYCQRSMDNLRSVVQQQNQLIQSLQGGKDVDPLVHTLQKDTVIQADELAGWYSSPSSRGSMPASDTSVTTGDGNARTRGYSAPFKSPSSTLSRPDSVPEKTVNRTRPPSAPLPTTLRGSQPLSDPIRPPSSTSFATSVQIQAHSAPVVGPNHSRPTSGTSNLSSVTLPSNSASTPNVSVPSQNFLEETKPVQVDDLTDYTVALHTQPSGEDTSKACPVCAVNFPDLTMSEFQNHVFDCYDNTDSGEIVRTQTGLSDASVSGIELEPQTSNRSRSRVCPVCNSDFHGDIPQAVFERHVHEHFGDQPDIVDDFQVLAP